MSTLAEIKARIADEIFRFDLDDQIARYITAAIRHYEKTRWWFNEGDATASYTAGSPYVTLPTGTQSIDRVLDPAGRWELWERKAAEIAGWVNAGSVPTQLSDFAREGDRLRLYGTPNVSGSLTLHGFFNAAPLTDEESNGWTTHGEDVLVARAKLMICRGVTLDATRAEIARRELYGSPDERKDTGAEGALMTLNRRNLSGSAPKVCGYL